LEAAQKNQEWSLECKAEKLGADHESRSKNRRGSPHTVIGGGTRSPLNYSHELCKPQGKDQESQLISKILKKTKFFQPAVKSLKKNKQQQQNQNKPKKQKKVSPA